MELGERIDQTITREVYEETGLEVKPTRLVGVYSGREFRFTYPNGDQVNAVSTLFDCRIVGGRLQADGVESLEVRFFAPMYCRRCCRVTCAAFGTRWQVERKPCFETCDRIMIF